MLATLRGAVSETLADGPPEGWPFGAALRPFGAGVDGPGPSESRRSRASGSGRSATWVSRMTAISAAIIAFGATETSSIDFSSICHMRVRARIGRLCAMPRPRAFSSGGTVGSSAASGVILMTEIQCVTSARSRRTAIGSAPSAYWADSSVKAAAASPFMIMSKRSRIRPRSARPSMART